MRPHETYADCEEIFRAVGTNIRCPRCMSSAFVPASIILWGIYEREMALEILGDGKTCVNLVERSTQASRRGYH